MHIERSGQLRIFLECRSASGKSSDWQEKCGRPTRSRSAARTRTDAAHRLTLAICSVASIIASCRAAAPPLEVPFADWDAGAGQGPSCSVTQDGKSGDHVPYFRWSGDHVAVCVEPARDPGPCFARCFYSSCVSATLTARVCRVDVHVDGALCLHEGVRHVQGRRLWRCRQLHRVLPLRTCVRGDVRGDVLQARLRPRPARMLGAAL